MIFTEIEAIQQYANVKVFLYGLGGLSGREGGISFIVVGTKEEIIKVKSFIQTIKGEPPFQIKTSWSDKIYVSSISESGKWDANVIFQN